MNLEKRNHVKKQVRKLHISGVISTDPFMIMGSQRKFYKNLYRSRNVNLDNAESSIFFDSPNLPCISHESSIICEYVLTPKSEVRVTRIVKVYRKSFIAIKLSRSQVAT